MKEILTIKKVELYTDGACSGNPGPGGWAAILKCDGYEKSLSGFEASTTNNRMELVGAIKGLEALKYPCDVTLYSDSEYLVNAMSLGWAEKWRANNWMRAKNAPAKNPELFEKLLSLCKLHSVSFVWVKGHASNVYNNRCDELAVREIKTNS